MRSLWSLPALTVILSVAGCAAGSISSGTHTITAGPSPGTHSPLDRTRTQDARGRGRPVPPPTVGLGRRTKTTGCAVRGQQPDTACTPGAVVASVTLAQICRPGYATSVRNVPESVKRKVYAEYGAAPAQPGAYEVDHLVPLEVGGSNAIANLWPQPSPGYAQKDQVENELHDAVCAGRFALSRAQLEIARDWRHAGVLVSDAGTSAAPAAGAGNPTGGSSPEAPGSTTHAGDATFCASHGCIANFPAGRGTVMRCADGLWSHSGGLPGVCNRHGGPH